MASIMNEHAAFPYLRQAEMKEFLKPMGTAPRLPHITRKSKKKNRAIIVSNIDLDTKKKTITKSFKKFGNIFSIELVKDEDGAFTGVAHVEYK
jgi:RNA recognition motif-containing protein